MELQLVDMIRKLEKLIFRFLWSIYNLVYQFGRCQSINSDGHSEIGFFFVFYLAISIIGIDVANFFIQNKIDIKPQNEPTN